ncbi:hemin-degrading factor [Pseudomonas sp. N040]|uniref:hemin-degrading factor n=1 Tax=Pseudomonas sp. N040 TaxID=2785325 RepID=UPI0018A31AD8|nr:ChuX/HutX family heme-like substrate-binding protein [Pseudomonas sp. N040]MBF7730426.1 hemin-degrading factor [Pseudomonas sp. N040]MBW7014069.1 hemin-degrading factor [Pseudomonas sp. N040]
MQTQTPLTPTATPLYQAWQQLRSQQSGLRARDAAARLSVSEAELTASRIGIDSVRLRPEWADLLPALEALGYVMALTRNEHCVHERKGHYREVSVMPNGQMGMVVSADIDLRLFMGGWDSVFAVEEETVRGTQRSIQIFDRQGTAVHKVFLTASSQLEAWAPLVERFRAEEQNAALDLQPLPAAEPIKADELIEVGALREAWSQLKDTHHFFALLRKYGTARTQALRLAGREWAEPLAPELLPQLLEQAGADEVPIMVFVGNQHCIQIHSGPVRNLRWLDAWFNVMDPEFNLHLKTTSVASLWRVRKPSSDGIVTSWEAFDANGEMIVQLFGARKPGIPERADWRELAESFAALPA